MDIKEKYRELMDIATVSKMDFYSHNGKRAYDVSIQKRPLEETGLIISNLMVLEKLEEICEKLTTKVEDIVVDDKPKVTSIKKPATK